MRLLLCAIGRLKAGPERELLDRYLVRSKALARSAGFAGVETSEIDEARGRSAEDRKRDEASALRGRLADGARSIVFDEQGRSFTSQDFVGLLTRAREERVSTLGLVIGGPDGLAADYRSQASAVLAFGGATMPHQIVRVLVAEQVYRAMTILTGHPYHRA